MNPTAFQVETQNEPGLVGWTVHTFNMRTLAVRILLVCWLVMAGTGPLYAAGCIHGPSPSNGQSYTDSLQTRVLDPGLLGKWQYVGGQADFVFYPAPAPCDGPGCRRAPEPAPSMSVIPSSSTRAETSVGLNVQALYNPVEFAGVIWPVEQPGHLSPWISGLLRPPC